MRIVVERSALVDALAAVNARACGKMNIPILKCVRIDAQKSRVSILAHWLDACCSFEISGEVHEPGLIAVDAGKLYGLVNGFAIGCQVSMSVADGEVEIKAGRSRYRLPVLPPADFPPPLSAPDAVEFSLPAADFARLLGTPETAMSDAVKTRRYLCGIYLHRLDSVLATCATDGSILIRLRSDAAAPAFPPIIIPRESISDLCSHLDDDGEVHVSCAPRLLSIRSGERTYTTKLIDGVFPPYEKVIPPDTGFEIYANRKELLGALQRLCVLLDDRTTVTIKWADGAPALTIFPFSGAEGGEEEVDSNGGEIGAGQFTTPAARLVQLLSAITYDEVKMIFTDGSKPLRIEGAKDDAVVQLIMPIDMGQKAEATAA